MGHYGHRGGEARYVVAKRFTEAARLQEVALHVDDDERGSVKVDSYGGRFGFDRYVRHRR